LSDRLTSHLGQADQTDLFLSQTPTRLGEARQTSRDVFPRSRGGLGRARGLDLVRRCCDRGIGCASCLGGSGSGIGGSGIGGGGSGIGGASCLGGGSGVGLVSFASRHYPGFGLTFDLCDPLLGLTFDALGLGLSLAKRLLGGRGSGLGLAGLAGRRGESLLSLASRAGGGGAHLARLLLGPLLSGSGLTFGLGLGFAGGTNLPSRALGAGESLPSLTLGLFLGGPGLALGLSLGLASHLSLAGGPRGSGSSFPGLLLGLGQRAAIAQGALFDQPRRT
jgi:hypothetical protein